MNAFEDKTVLITGASAGIGLELAKEFARKGANLVLTARRLDRLEKLAQEISKEYRQPLTVACDVKQEDQLKQVVSEAILKFKSIDVVVANAGFGVAGKMDSLTVEDYRRQFETNIFGVLKTVYATLDELKKSHGTLVLIGSVAGYIALPGSSPYSMSKFAIHAFANSIRTELRPFGVSVVLIVPGFVESEIRRVDNQGKFKPQAHDPIPSWIRMPAHQAAKHIVRAVERKKDEEIITFHGKCLVFFQRKFPRGMSFLLRKLKLRGRPQPV